MVSNDNSYLNLRFIVFILSLLFMPMASATSVMAQINGQLPAGMIFDSNTSEDYIKEVYEEVYDKRNRAVNPELALFYLGSHWTPSQTATNDGTSSAQGESLTLTWSILPDGTFMPQQFVQDTGCNSSLIADLDAAYGAGNWQAEIAKVFDDWSSKTANKYVFEPNDDGAAWPGSPGVLGVRGDLRIGGCTIDGNSNILAFNFFPNNGDMKIDSKDNFYGGNLTTSFHNVISHEHGHGAGVEHVCPVNQTKLMEPFISNAFIGLQHDDIRAIQRHYGDRNELIGGFDNDVATRATNLGEPFNNVSVEQASVSIDDDGDEDWYSFVVGENGQVDITVTPIGSTYLNGPQNSDGSCTPGTLFNSLAVHDLDFEIVDTDGSTVINTGDANGAGQAESLNNIALGPAGVKYIRVFGGNANDIQLYNLQFTVKSGGVPLPEIDVTTTALNAVQTTDSVSEQTLTIRNDGGGSLIWTVDEAPSPIMDIPLPQNFVRQRLTSSPIIEEPDSTRSGITAAALTDVIVDGGFEAGPGSGTWVESSTNFGTPICDFSCGNVAGERSGDYWVWFGGAQTYEESSVLQNISIPVGVSAELSFYIAPIDCDSTNDYLEVTIDGSQVYFVNGSSTLCDTTSYSPVTVDVSVYADGGVHTIEFHSETFANNGGISNFWVDDVTLNVEDDPCTAPSDLPWLSLLPTSGTVDSGAEVDVLVTFDSTGLIEGDYAGTLCINSNDLISPTVKIPATLTVEEVALSVTVGYVSSSRNGAAIDLRWQTATETGNAGFNILIEEGDSLVLLNEEMISSAVIDSVLPIDYSYTAETDAERFYIDEVAVSGERTRSGPFVLGQDYGSSSPAASTEQPRTVWLPFVIR